MKNCLVMLVVALSVATARAETAATKNAATKGAAVATTNAAESAANAAAQTAARKGEALVATNGAAQVDVYAIADPAEALEAMRRKWPGVAERVPQSEMPDYTERFAELDRAQDWCDEDHVGRAKVFESVSLEGIRLKIEPPAWHYNLACALAQQGKKKEVFAALEQAVASGYNNAPYTRKHKVLTSLHDDPRFAKLMAMCDEIKKDWIGPEKPAVIESGSLRLDETNVYWGLKDASYGVAVVGATSNTLIYLGHNVEHRPAPLADMVEVKYSAVLENKGRAQGPANFNFRDARTGRFIPTILSGVDLTCPVNLTNNVESIPATLWADSDAAEAEARDSKS